MVKCRVCGTILTENNTTPAYLKQGTHICRKCNNETERKLRARKNKAKIEYSKLMKLNALGGLNIKILSHAKSGEPMYVVEQIGFEETKTNYYQAWGDFIGALKTIFKGMNK